MIEVENTSEFFVVTCTVEDKTISFFVSRYGTNVT
jgi:hypothetical protein